jgi:hypothetical protein
VATEAEAEYLNWQTKLLEVSANPRPNYTLPGGPSVDFVGYVKFLREMRDAARKAMIEAQGPFQVDSVQR